jgi:hypothetical protein
MTKQHAKNLQEKVKKLSGCEFRILTMDSFCILHNWTGDFTIKAFVARIGLDCDATSDNIDDIYSDVRSDLWKAFSICHKKS